jgi:hypothetical protein
MTVQCKRKVPFHTRALAEDALRFYLKENPRDPRNKTLVVYQCSNCGLLHLGHGRKAASKPAHAPKPKGPTEGELRRAANRKAQREAEQAARNQFYADQHRTLQFCKMLVEREIARYEAAGVPKRNSSAAF